jgi:xanthine dehydrogenase YagS FAD-binding subunit
MRPFRYQRAGDAAAAVALAGGGDAMFLGGGTNLVDLMKLGVETPARLVDVSRIGLDAIEPTPGGGLRIGAAVRNSDLAADPLVRERYPALSQALLAGASGQLRNVATVAGNLLQRTRCGYFQDVTKPCNKRAPGSGCPARAGDHRNLAVLGASQACIATHPSDMAVAMAALDTVVCTRGGGGARRIPLGDLYVLPGDRPDRETSLAPGELIEAVELGPPPAAASAYRKVRDRASFSFALVSIAASVAVEEGIVAEVRIALGGVAPVPWRAVRAERALRGAPAAEEGFGRAADAELAAAEPLPGNAYKVLLARNLIVRTLAELTGAGA